MPKFKGKPDLELSTEDENLTDDEDLRIILEKQYSLNRGHDVNLSFIRSSFCLPFQLTSC